MKWNDPIDLERYKRRLRASSDPAMGTEVAAYLDKQAEGFHCDVHPSEGPAVQFREDFARVLIVCASCRREAERS